MKADCPTDCSNYDEDLFMVSTCPDMDKHLDCRQEYVYVDLFCMCTRKHDYNLLTAFLCFLYLAEQQKNVIKENSACNCLTIVSYLSGACAFGTLAVWIVCTD